MLIYVIATALNLIGMGYLFYVRDIQKQVNLEILKHVTITNAIMQMLKDDLEKAENRIAELESKNQK